jgi:hypothetical protein
MSTESEQDFVVFEMMKKFLLILSLFFVVACQSEDEIETSIVGLDISPTSDIVAYAILTKSGVSIYIAKLNESNASLILAGSKETSYLSPTFSPDGARLAVIRGKTDDLHEQTILIVDLIGNPLDSIVVSGGIITEAKYSNDGEEILFCRAREFAHYSPIVPSAPHGVDIYSLNLRERTVSKLTDLDGYVVKDLEVIGNDTILFNMKGDSSGLYLLKRSAKVLMGIPPVNNPRGDLGYYYSPIYCSITNTLIFAAPYQIYSMSLEKRFANLIYDGRGKSHIYWIKVASRDCRVYFTHSAMNLLVFSVAIDGSDLRSYPIKID